MGPWMECGDLISAQSSLKQRLRIGCRESRCNVPVIDEPELFERTCDALEAGHAVGWFQGRMEFGPRALGARSILGDARQSEMKKMLNLKIKYRESPAVRALSVLREDVTNFLALDADSPYMLLVADVKHNRRCIMTSERERLFVLIS